MSFSNYQSLQEEVELITDSEVLKSIVRRLLKENHILSRKTNTTIQSLENQNILICYLQSTITALLNWSSMAAHQLCDILGYELLTKFQDIVRCKTIINSITRDYVFEDDKGSFKELREIASCVSINDINIAKTRCIDFLNKLRDSQSSDVGNMNNTERQQSEGIGNQERRIAEYHSALNDKYTEEINEENDMNETEEVEARHVHVFRRRKNSKPYEFHNGRMTLKKYRNNLHKKNLTASLKQLPKSRSSRPVNRSPKKAYKPSTLSDSVEKSDNSIINTEPEEHSKVKQKYKRRINEINEENLSNSVENSKSLKNVSPEKSPPLKKIRGSLKDSSQNSIDVYQECKPFCISLIDILNDPAAESNELVSQFKQTYITKDDENEYEIVDDVDASSEEEKGDNSDDNKSDSGGKGVHEDASHQSSSNENDASDPEHGQKEDAPDKSPARKDDDGKKGPRTPPPSSPIAPFEIFRRGPCTPPGEAPPESDSSSGRPV